MEPDPRARTVDPTPTPVGTEIHGGPAMYHPDTMLQLARERQERFQAEARLDRLASKPDPVTTKEQAEEPTFGSRLRRLRWSPFPHF